jgi:ATP-dependent helicase/nuclease subunit A
MDSGILTRYSASAGSGKTTELTRRYILKLFSSAYSYRKILAVTFTNKAASEMKGRILTRLWEISSGQKQSEAECLSAVTRKTVEQVKTEAGKILVNILHDYSRFSVGTIDSFFQKVLKSFARESGLQSGYQIELDHSLILSEAVNNLISEIDNDKELLNWITEFAEKRVEEGKTWNIKAEILGLAEELFREKFKLLPFTEKEKLRDRQLLADYVNELKQIRWEFTSHLHLSVQGIRKKIDRHGVMDEMFYQGKRGVPSFLKKISDSPIDTEDPPGSYVQKVFDDPPRWFSKPVSQLSDALNDGLDEEIIAAVRYYNDNFLSVNTADSILSNIYTLGILSDIHKNVHEITTEENKFLLSDAGELLFNIIGNDQTPFIYEKIGNYFENYMIDEFQDTSAIQWQNFKPLINNSMGEGFDNLVVGDVKQSIYRWRNSDWKIFGEIISREIGDERIKYEKLDTNYRSRSNIVAFNNSLFSVIPEIIDDYFENKDRRIRQLYADAPQNHGGKKDGGFVSLEFVSDSEDETFRDKVLAKLPGLIEDLQDKGYKGSDIGILVRGNKEGSEILRYMLDYSSSVGKEKKEKYNYGFISSESLFLDQNPAVQFTISLLKWLYSPDDHISKATALRNYLLATGKDIYAADDMLIDPDKNEKYQFLPEHYEKLFIEIKHLSVFEAVERIISFFSLGIFPGNAVYLCSFQDCIMEYSVSRSSEILDFLDWWAIAGVKKSIVLSEQEDSIRVMTIHKSKGLQFRVVILPFLSWQLTHEKNPTLWIKPKTDPFNKLGLVPVTYKKSLENSHFASEYYEERFSSVVDNLNLMYVAFTRAVDCLFGFSRLKQGKNTLTVPSVIASAFKSDKVLHSGKPTLPLKEYFNIEKSIFVLGEIPDNKSDKAPGKVNDVTLQEYKPGGSLNRLKLKFHGENFLVSQDNEQVQKLNYGKLMHEIFSLISTTGDVNDAVERLYLEGKIPENQKDILRHRIMDLLSSPVVSGWFEKSGVVIKETDILLPSGSTKRPDRIIIKDDKTVIIDFKFGFEKSVYMNQVSDYKKLMHEMGYSNIDAFIWYVDINKIVKV